MPSGPEILSMWGSSTVLRGPDGVAFRYDPGAACLLLTTTGGEGERAVYERLHTPGDLRRWLSETFAFRFSPVDAETLAAAKTLREAIWQAATARVHHRPLPTGAVRVINRAAREPTPVPRIGPGGERSLTVPVAATQALSLLARDAIDVLAEPLAGRVRQCAGDNCTLLFVDTSRPGQRRWCSMQRCGNRAKVKSHRNRHDKEPQP